MTTLLGCNENLQDWYFLTQPTHILEKYLFVNQYQLPMAFNSFTNVGKM